MSRAGIVTARHIPQRQIHSNHNSAMEVGAHVWLRKEDSHWGWVPAVVTSKESIELKSGAEVFELTLQNDDSDESFSVTLRVDPEQLKTADHEDIKLRNMPSSYHFSGSDPEAQVMTSPNVHSDAHIVGGVDDLIGLTHLHEPAILHALRLRYDEDIIYTSTGPILIAVNPFKKMPHIYSDDKMQEYRRQGESAGTATSFTTPFKNSRYGPQSTTPARQQVSESGRLPPHVYQIADDAYRAMLRGMENSELMRNPKAVKRGQSSIVARSAPTNQSVLVSGESGAGKTVTTKIVLQYLAMLSRMRSARSTPRSGTITMDLAGIEQQVLQSNPILEAFGNARTLRNDNSSRFGKYIDVRFARNGTLSGAMIETYLLEKVRLIHPGVGERNYHVFYQFLASATAQQRRDWFLGRATVENFKLLSQSGTYTRRDGVSDKDMHQEMLDAMVRELTGSVGSLLIQHSHLPVGHNGLLGRDHLLSSSPCGRRLARRKYVLQGFSRWRVVQSCH